MYTTVMKVQQATGYDVTLETIERAQFIIEAFTGKSESEIEDPDDLSVLSNATSFQAAYMATNFAKVYEQVAFVQKAQSDSAVTMDRDLYAPFLAPLAVLALRRLSWVRSRSVRVGGTFAHPSIATRWEMD
jgi:hypothetical protein